MAMNIYDARSVLPGVKYQIAPYFWTNKLFSSGSGGKNRAQITKPAIKTENTPCHGRNA